DTVYVNMSSSFPGLNLSLISALDTLNLRGVIINSIGSSMYRANNEGFTFLEMAEYLKSKNMIKNNIKLYTLGGDADEGLNFDEDTKKSLIERVKNMDIQRLDFKDLNDNIKKRINYYEEYPNPKYFINIGGNLVSSKLEKYYKNLGVPTLTMLNIKQIALANGISNTKETSILYDEFQNLVFYFGILLIFIGYVLFKVYFNMLNSQ
ncbi:poly-gamma-glutamate system protein, partial [Cetobacterium sp.]